MLCVVKHLSWVLHSIPWCEYTIVCLFPLDFGILVLFSLVGHLCMSFSCYAYLYSLGEKFCMIRYLHHHVNSVSVPVHSCLVQFPRSVVPDSLRSRGLQHTRSPYPSPNSHSLLKLMSIESVMPSNRIFLCCPLLLLPSIFPSITVFFQWVSPSHQVAKVWEFQLQHQSFQWIFRTDFL